METSAKIQWIMDCAQRLTELRPELTPDQADSLSCEVWEKCSGSMNPRKAAEAEYPHVSSISQWEWARRFAERLAVVRPKIWVPTATAIAILTFERDRDLEPEAAAEKYAKDEARNVDQEFFVNRGRGPPPLR